MFIFGDAPNAKFNTLYGYQFTLSTKLIRPNDLVILLTDAAPQFFKKFTRFIYLLSSLLNAKTLLKTATVFYC